MQRLASRISANIGLLCCQDAEPSDKLRILCPVRCLFAVFCPETASTEAGRLERRTREASKRALSHGPPIRASPMHDMLAFGIRRQDMAPAGWSLRRLAAWSRRATSCDPKYGDASTTSGSYVGWLVSRGLPLAHVSKRGPANIAALC